MDNLFLPDTDSANKSVAAVPRKHKLIPVMTKISLKDFSRMGFDSSIVANTGAFNSGVFVINAPMWRTYNLIQDFEIIVTKLNAVHYKLFPGMSTRQDTQTPLNLLTIHHGGIVELNNTWNVEGYTVDIFLNHT